METEDDDEEGEDDNDEEELRDDAEDELEDIDYDPLVDDNNENLLADFENFVKAPLPRLINDIPLRPKLIPTLVPQQLNLWMGAAPPEGVSSGLHHDYADNLYILLQGTKRVTLIAPSAAPKLDLYGDADLQVVHENGLISYDWAIGSDGSYAADVARWRYKVAAKALRDGVKAKMEGAEDVDLDALRKDVVESKQELDLAEEEEEEAAMYNDDDDDEDDDEEEDEDVFIEAPKDDGDDDEDEEMDDPERDDYVPDEGEDDIDEPPASFSKIDSGLLHSAQLTETYPELANVVKTTFEIKEGEMLYIPASWFHEVRSGPTSSKVGPHVALNYWFHPPNSLTPEDYETPYKTDFWSEQWESLESLIKKDSKPAIKNNSAKGWSKLVKGSDGEWVVSETANKEKDTVEEYQSYDEIPTHLRLAFKNPGVWTMRNAKTGMFMGRAKQATRH
ncbi:Clavaminate synthase-like protein [Rhizoclosmatium globosum]|uniref:Clavaminate synthase-like protein n=1 Tax=Rhizoclosmatium globosum TaxID=329046 RepID=A0A1Y2BZM6_9FUNG|nr:Clavaminate synthase-like protein [Rhizoclosmatium globosum]|eukprot:ORY40211.1 Clavaminate synthase-like protein [Rhizoclosmatium globosum]